MINVLHGRHVGVVPVARRSSRLVPPPWVAAQPRARVQLVQLLHALGDGPSSHALAKHGRRASPRRARPTGRVPLRSQAVRLSLYWCATRGRARSLNAPWFGQARCARCARRDRSGTPWDRASSRRGPSPPRRWFASVRRRKNPRAGRSTVPSDVTSARTSMSVAHAPCQAHMSMFSPKFV